MGRLRGICDLRRNAFEVVAGVTRERVSEAVEIGAVAHFFGEDVGDVIFATDV